MKKIVFYDKTTTEVLTDTDDFYFIMNDVVWKDNSLVVESHHNPVQFYDFIEECPNIGWLVSDD